MRKMDIKEVQGELLELMKKLHAFLSENGLSYYLIAGSTLGAVRHGGFIPWDDDIDIGMMREDYEAFLQLAHRFDPQYDIVNFQNGKHCDFVLCRIYINNTMIDNPQFANTKLDQRLYLDVFPLDNVPEDEAESAKFERKIRKKRKLLAYCDAKNYNNGKAALMAKKALACCLSPMRSSILKSVDRLMKKYRDCETPYVCSLCSQYSFKKQKMPKAYYGTPVLHLFDGCEFYVPAQTDAYLTHLYGGDYMEMPPESKRRKGHDIYKTNEA